MRGLKVGHVSNADKGSGVTVFLLDYAVGAYWICGGAPATHEIVVLDPDSSVPNFNALMFSGGSAYGLFAAKGVMVYLTEHNIGHPVPHGVVPIVPAAAIYDLAYLKAVPPSDEEAYQACLEAKVGNTDSGRIGAGFGATVGKLIPNARHMTGGLGRAEICLPNDVLVIAYAVVNSVGDIRKDGDIIAGARVDDQFADCDAYLLSGQADIDLFTHSNTTLVAVFTNAAFSKSELKRIAKMASAGMARTISPIFTRYDGDIVFCVSTGEKEALELTVGAAAADAVRLAILDAVRHSEVI